MGKNIYVKIEHNYCNKNVSWSLWWLLLWRSWL